MTEEAANAAAMHTLISNALYEGAMGAFSGAAPHTNKFK